MLTIFLDFILGFIVFNQENKTRTQKSFILLCFISLLWTISNYMTVVSNSIFWFNSTYAFGSLVMCSGIIWTLNYTEIHLSKKRLIVIIIPFIALFFLSYFKNFITISYSNTSTDFIYLIRNGWGFYIYTALYIVGAFTIISILIKRYSKIIERNQKHLNLIIIIGIILSLLIISLNSFIFPHFSIIFSGVLDNIGFSFFLVSIFLGIFKYYLFNIRLITLEITVFLLWMIIFIRATFSNSITEIFVESSILFVTIIISNLLIKSIVREISLRKEKEFLVRKLSVVNNKLKSKITHQTKEVRKAYEIENRARKDLEKLNETKDQFIMLTQHNLRSPITTIKSELELLINGHNGKIDDTALNSIIRTKSSADRLSQIVDDFLNITTIKIGSQILKLATGNVKSIIENVINDLRLEVEEMRVKINYISSENIWPDIKMDINKIREALTIIIENAIKYNFDRGVINISNTIVDNNIILSIENTGVGITSEESQSIFNKLFYRGMRARERNPIGMGIGLQVAKAIISGHKGKISIESLGENYGACVEIILPINSYNEA